MNASFFILLTANSKPRIMHIRTAATSLPTCYMTACNVDALGVQGKRAVGRLTHQIFAGPLTNNRVVVALINTSPNPLSISVRWSQLGLPAWKRMKARDMWKVSMSWGCVFTPFIVSMQWNREVNSGFILQKEDIAAHRTQLEQQVNSHDISLLILTPI